MEAGQTWQLEGIGIRRVAMAHLRASGGGARMEAAR